jgi:hypothetical protein
MNPYAQLGHDISHLFQDINAALHPSSGGSQTTGAGAGKVTVTLPEIIHDVGAVIHDIVGIINHPSESISFHF